MIFYLVRLWYILPVSCFLIMGQYVHLPKHVQCVGIIDRVSILIGGYEIEALVSISVRFGNLLEPMMGLSGNVWAQSLLSSMMFQFP